MLFSKQYPRLHPWCESGFSHLPDNRLHSWIWKSKVVLRIKVFAWLLVRNWNVTNNFTCVLCLAHLSEDWIHILFYCNFSRRIWTYLQVNWTHEDTMEDMFIKARKSASKPFF
jgi:hypothetical protein